MPIHFVEVILKSEADGAHVLRCVQSLSEYSPFILHDAQKVEPDVWTCTFIISRPELVVGFRSVTELLSRLAIEFEVYKVERFEISA